MSSHPEEQPGQDRPEAPRFRSGYDKTKVEERAQTPKKWDKDRKVWMRLSPTEPFDYLKWVNNYEYDAKRGGWDYELREKDGTIYGWVKEDDTKRA